MATTIYVYDLETSAPIAGATVTCTNEPSQKTNAGGYATFDLLSTSWYKLRANADGYNISMQKPITGVITFLDFGLIKEEQIKITVKRPTWVSIELWPEQAEYPTGEELQVRGYLRFETEPYTEGNVWLIDDDAGEIISEEYPMGVSGFYVLKWTPSLYKAEGYNVTIGCDAFVSTSNPLGAWSDMPNGFTKHINVVGGGEGNMRIITFGPHGELLLVNTITACDDWEKACTKFKFQIWNESETTASAWYKVGFVGGGTLYEGTTPELGRGIGEFSEEITDYICALYGSLPVGTHTIKVEVGSIGYPEATHTKTEDITVISATTLSVTTHDATDVSQNSARIGGSIDNANDLETDIGFEYGETTDYGNTVWADVATTPCDFYKDIADLESHTLYHFRAIAENEAKSAHGEDLSFWTRKELQGTHFNITLPNTTLLESQEIMACGDHTLACTRFNFQIYNHTNTTSDAWYTVSILGGDMIYRGTITISAYHTGETISNHICAEGVGAGGLPVGEYDIVVEVGLVGQGPDADVSEWLTVLKYGTPTVETKGVENPTFNSATLVGVLKDVGIETRVGFEYGLLYGSMSTIWREGYTRSGEYKVAVRGLEGNEIYMFRAVAEAGEKVGYGEERSFLAAPAVIDVISLGWNLEDAKIDEYNAHFQITNLSEDRRYSLSLASARGHVYVQVSDVTGAKGAELKANIAQNLLEEHGYSLTCRVYDSDITDAILTQSYIVPPIDLELHTNIGGPITNIPTTIKTETSYPFIIQIDNTGEKDREAGVIFMFVGVGLGPRYVFEYPIGDLCDMDTTIIPAGESVGYEIMISLPNEAVPTGATSATYDLKVLLPVFA